MYTKRNTNKLKSLFSIDKRIFRASELALLWGITNQNTLKITLARSVKRGVFFRLKRGLYSTVTPSQLDPYEYGCAMSGPLSYVSTETILSQVGAINQLPNKITLFGQKSFEFSLGDQHYLCRYLHPHYLSNRNGVIDSPRSSHATPPRALYDLYHISPKYYVDNPQLIKGNMEVNVYAHS